MSSLGNHNTKKKEILKINSPKTDKEGCNYVAYLTSRSTKIKDETNSAVLGRHEAPLLKYSQQDMKPHGEGNKTASHMKCNRDVPGVGQFSHAEAGTTRCCSASALTVFLLCG